MTSRNRLGMILAAGLLAAGGRMAAADAAAPTVSADGSASVEKAPEFLRMVTNLQVDGPTMNEALAKLKSRREEVKASLLKLGAVESTIDLGEAKVVDASAGGRQEQISRMVRNRMASATPATGPAAGKPVTLATEIKADWPLATGPIDDMLVATVELQGKIKAAKVAAIIDPVKAARAEEAEEEDSGDSGQQAPKPGTPSFVYVVKITEAERAKAREEAFAKSKEAAARLAKAAGVSLGMFSTIAKSSNDSGQATTGLFTDNQSDADRYAAASRPVPDASGNIEVVSSEWGKITYQVSLAVTFFAK